MARVMLGVVALFSCFAASEAFFGLGTGGDAGGGTNCAACTVIVGLLEQMTVIHNVTIEKLMDDVCGYLPSTPLKDACDYLVKEFGVKIIEYVNNHETPDEVCHHMGICTLPLAQCALFPPPANRPFMDFSRVTPLRMRVSESPIEFLKNLINRFANIHRPLLDLDNDTFSTIPELRGSAWRGRDCHDELRDVYPGRRNTTHSAHVDHNCNGIFGSNAQGVSYEDLYCKNSGQLGVILIGDSGGAHFELPPSYFTAADINSTTFKQKPDAFYRLANEFDIPEKSFGTGYMDNTTNVPVTSLYEKMRARNLCNHRDYQNTGVNGARAGAVAFGSAPLDEDLSRGPNDHPVTVIYELIGNDVCNGHHTFDTMTKVADFAKAVLQSLRYLDSRLPQGSHVVFIGLADGRVLYDSLHNRTHPIGVPYSSVYSFLNCLEISPCWVWMNTNETVRNTGSARAAELNQVYGQIMQNYTFRNFDMAYYDFPFAEVMRRWTQAGGQEWQLIEPVDGFHPNQLANALIGEILYEKLLADHPSFLGPINPHNADITKLFGDQGGY